MKSIRIVNLHQNFLKLSRLSLCSPLILHPWMTWTTGISWEIRLRKSLHPWGQKTKESFSYWVCPGDQSTFSGFHSNASLAWNFLLTPTQNQIPVLGLDENTSKPLALYANKDPREISVSRPAGITFTGQEPFPPIVASVSNVVIPFLSVLVNVYLFFQALPQ